MQCFCYKGLNKINNDGKSDENLEVLSQPHLQHESQPQMYTLSVYSSIFNAPVGNSHFEGIRVPSVVRHDD